MAFPSTLKNVGYAAFACCDSLKAICLEGEHEVNLVGAWVPWPTRVILLSATVPGGTSL